jgi:RraA family protein
VTLGFRILPSPERPPQALVEALGEQVTPHLSDSMSRLQGASGAIRPMHRGARLVGVAFTVRVPAGDNLLVHKAIDLALPGDVIVVDAGGYTEQAIIGDIMSSLAATRELAGIVIDGAIRDAAEIASRDFPVYARAVTHRGPYKDGPGEINVPVSIGGMVVHPGDVIVGDADGLVAIPAAEAEAVLASARAIREKEERTLHEIATGTLDRAWVDATLKARGYKR